jgi:hypothetical protein
MKLVLACLAALASVATATTYMKENFNDGEAARGFKAQTCFSRKPSC